MYMHTDGDLACKHCPHKSFMQNWLFGCYHDNENKSEGVWIGLGSIGMLFAAMGKAATAMSQAGAPTDDLALVAKNINERWDHTRSQKQVIILMKKEEKE